MGAGVAVSYAAHALERVKRLGLISPVCHKMHRALVKTRPDIGLRLLRSSFSFLAKLLTRLIRTRMGFPKGIRDEAIYNSMWFNTLFDYEQHALNLKSLKMSILLGLPSVTSGSAKYSRTPLS